MQSKKLIHRLNRIQGQINAIKNKVSSNDTEDCERVLVELKTVSRALKKFGEAYVAENVEACFNAKKTPDQMQDQLMTAIRSAFDM